VVTLVAFIAILVTGRYPPGLFNFVRGYLAAVYRVLAFFPFLLTDRWVQDDSHPVWLHASPQPRMSRLLVLAKMPLWLLGVILGVTISGFLLATLLAIPAGFAILLTGRYPRGLFDPVVAILQWSARLTCWAYMFSDSRMLFGVTAPVRWLTITLVALSAVGTPYFIYSSFTTDFSFSQPAAGDIREAEAVVEEFLAAGRDGDIEHALSLMHRPESSRPNVERLFQDRYRLDGFVDVDTEAGFFLFGPDSGLTILGEVRYRSGKPARFTAYVVEVDGEWKISSILINRPQ
jgi:hypothetical protein